ncbi:hypothetical protein [Enterococcus sp. AZ072]|uniref:hypothetical protein n=1 Tax=unclassified Enterococcus TaxID=2608891 RepID=UPI003D2D10B5
MTKKFTPLIDNSKSSTPAKTTLEEKQVAIKGNKDFGRIAGDSNTKKVAPQKKLMINEEDPRLKATMTQKVSPAVNLKINTLKPFLGELENMPKATVNEIIDLLIDSYTGTRLTTRQQEAFKSMYEMQYEMIKK